jgi:hypothetical protein
VCPFQLGQRLFSSPLPRKQASSETKVQPGRKTPRLIGARSRHTLVPSTTLSCAYAVVKERRPKETLRSLKAGCKPTKSELRFDLVAGWTSCEATELLRKEVIQPQVPLRLPCYDFTPVTSHSLGACLLAVGSATSGATDSHGVTGGVYKARERIHRGVLIRDY